jgi:putative transposase
MLRMPNYRRHYDGTTWFFTVVTAGRRAYLTCAAERNALRDALQHCRQRYPFRIDAWVLLPDHLHAIWTMPETDTNYSRRWSIVKRIFTQRMRESTGEHSAAARQRIVSSSDADRTSCWQPRFWAHRISGDRDFAQHIDYIHINPMKHGHVARVVDWTWSSFHRYARDGLYPVDWGGTIGVTSGVGRE